MHMHPWILSALPLLAVVAALEERAANPTVTIASGVVVGTATGVLNQPTVTGLVNAYLGIPYASPPLSSLRFEPPVAPKAWSTPLKAQTPPPACLQQFGTGSQGALTKKYFNDLDQPPTAGQNEDCLYLNVWAPQDASPTKLKAVMFWLFGGNLEFGTGSLGFYNGSSLAVNEDVVVVAINYRTNIFGFSNSPEVQTDQQNSGFLDQRFALQWVQKNIAAFGGDPTQVTLFGQSAGGYSIKQLLAKPPSPLPFRAAIMESEGALLSTTSAQSYQNVSTHFGCNTQTSPLKCLQGVNSLNLVNYVNNNGLLFSPVVDATNAGQVKPEIDDGSFADVPIMIGVNKDEATVFLNILGLPSSSNVPAEVLALTGIDISSVYPALLNNYSSAVTNSAFQTLAQIAEDVAYTCPTEILSYYIAYKYRQPVWRYRYDGSFPDTTYFPNAGAYHSSEISMVFGTYPLSDQFGSATPTQVALSKYMQGAWAGFAKNPAGGPGWPKLLSNYGVELGVLGGMNNTTGESTQSQFFTSDIPCLLLDPVIKASGAGY